MIIRYFHQKELIQNQIINNGMLTTKNKTKNFNRKIHLLFISIKTQFKMTKINGNKN